MKLRPMSLFLALWSLWNLALAPVSAETGKSHRLVGKFQKAQGKYERIAPAGYFFTIVTEKGENLAFPVTFKSEKEREAVAKHGGKTFLLEGERASLTTLGEEGEARRQVHVLKINSLREASLEELQPKLTDTTALGTKGQAMERPTSAQRKTPSSPGATGLNDTVTNAAIFTAGAVLLGSILAK